MARNLMQDPEWWSYSLDQTIPGDPCGISTPLVPMSQCPLPGVQPSHSYEGALDVLRLGQLNPEEAKVLLARAKCMRKWRFAPASLAKARKNEALDGFIARNNAARALRGSETIPWAIRLRMRELLSKWMPDLGIVADGRFGPGQCAERWNHCRRFTRLAQWCTASVTWPEQPTGHADMSAHVARLCAVPKQYDKDRLITVEPAYNTFAQQYVRDVLLASVHAGPLKGSCMDLASTDGQRIQRRLAQKASRDGSLATLDLKDASDNISWDDVRAVFPSWVIQLLEVSRSDSFTDPRDKSEHPLAIYAGMGNATTFVVETLFFSAYVKAFAWTRGLKCRVSVFGDDVICTDEVARMLLAEGESPCFVVNKQKSFVGNDALRESCGIFAYQGVDITVPRIDGYASDWAGREGLAALGRTLNRDPLFYGLASAMAADGGLPVTRRWIIGYPTLVDPLFCAPVDEELEQSVVRDPGLQRLVVKVAGAEPRYEEVRCTNAPDDFVTKGLLCACLLGQARTVRRGHHSYVRFPSSEVGDHSLRRVKRWHEVVSEVPPSDEDLKVARQARRLEAALLGMPIREGYEQPRAVEPCRDDRDIFPVPVKIWRCSLNGGTAAT